MEPAMSTRADAATIIPVLDDDPFSPTVLADPYDLHRRMREAGPVVRLERYRVWCMGRHEQVTDALSDWGTFCSAAGVGLSDFRREKPWRPPSLLLEADPPDHTIVRRVMAGVLTPRAVKALRASFEPAAERMAEALVQRGIFDAVADLAEVYPLRVFPDAVGLAEEGRENLLPYGSMVFNTFGPRNDLFEAAFARAAVVLPWIHAGCQRESLAPDGLGAQIWAAADRNEITHEQAPLLVRSLLSAGVDTTVFGLGNAMYCLAANPEQWNRLHADPGLAKFAFEEALRLESPVQTFFRTTTRDVDVDGARIPAGEKVLLFLGAANRDARRWGNDADRYDIRRQASGHVAFGQGIHACVGQAIARLEGELILGALARRVSRLELAGETRPRLNNTLRGFSSVPVRAVTG
jgi:cytochrome P450